MESNLIIECLENQKVLLKKGNLASYYDYKTFIDKNENYPRIGRIKYLSEHKLSTDKVSPKKIINSFDSTEPLSGFGEMILGESFILTGDIKKGTKLIKKGWVTAELTKSELRFFRKKYEILRFILYSSNFCNSTIIGSISNCIVVPS